MGSIKFTIIKFIKTVGLQENKPLKEENVIDKKVTYFRQIENEINDNLD